MRAWFLGVLCLSNTAWAGPRPDWVVAGAGAGAAAVSLPLAILVGNATAGASSNLVAGLLPPVLITTLVPPAATVGTMAFVASKRGTRLRAPVGAYAASAGVGIGIYAAAVALHLDTHRPADVLGYTLAGAALLPIVPALLVREAEGVVVLPWLGGDVAGGVVHARF